MGGGGGDDAPAASTPATTGGDSPAPAAAAAAPTPAVVDSTPAVPDPVAPWVEAANTRQKIPYWAIPVLALLPIWAAVYMLTLDTPTPTELGPLEAGAEVYSSKGCSGCHGATGAGSGANPALTGAEGVTQVWEKPADMIVWVALGSAGYKSLGNENYGDGAIIKPINGGMPAWGDSLSADELMDVVLHERTVFGEEEFDIEKWKDGFEEILSASLPADKVAAYTAVLEEWEANPPEPAA